MLTTKKAAEYLNISYYYLRNMRNDMYNHDGPKFKIGSHLRGTACYYSIEELEKWKSEHKRRNRKYKI